MDPAVNKKMSIMRQTKTRPTNIWKDPMFFFPMAVPVHGHLLKKSDGGRERNQVEEEVF